MKALFALVLVLISGCASRHRTEVVDANKYLTMSQEQFDIETEGIHWRAAMAARYPVDPDWEDQDFR